MERKEIITKVMEGDCVKANAFFEENGVRRVLTGWVIDNKYFVDDKTEEIYETSKFDLINNTEDFED